MHVFSLVVASVDNIYFEGDAYSVTCPGKDGEVTILKDHVSFVTPLKSGEIVIRSTKGEERVAVEKGILEVHKGGTTILL